MANYWLVKTEPTSYSYDDLEREKTAVWDGVKNPVALRNLREMRPGDQVLIYHTGDEKAVVGWATVVSAPYPDPKRNDARLVVIDIRPVQALRRRVPLAEMRANPKLKGFDLLRLPRLSVMPVSEEQWAAIMEMADA